MIIFKKKVLFVTVKEHWYTAKFRFSDFFFCCVYFNIPSTVRPSEYFVSFPGKTIVISLKEHADTIFAGFSKQTRNCIRQADKSGIEVSFETSIADFIAFYNLFAEIKKLPRISVPDFEHLNGAFRLCQVSYKGEVLAMHFYLLDKDSGQVQLFRSASRRIFDTSIESNVIGKANKYLHYRAIIYFKALEFRLYDFGGFSHIRDRNYTRFLGINRFKKSFGGFEMSYTNYATPLYVILKFFAGKLKRNQ